MFCLHSELVREGVRENERERIGLQLDLCGSSQISVALEPQINCRLPASAGLKFRLNVGRTRLQTMSADLYPRGALRLIKVFPVPRSRRLYILPSTF